MKMPDEFLEIGTWVGWCPNKCDPYCPQEINNARYQGKKIMSIDDFRTLTSTVPKNVCYSWAGPTEPFVNRQTIGMMEIIQERGNPQILFTSGIGLKPEDAERLKNIRFEWLILHTPDRQGHIKIKITDDYEQVVGKLISSTNTIRKEVMSMDDECFVTDNNERLFRPGNESLPGKPFRVICDSLRGPQYSLLPDGNLYFCCVTKALDNIVGSLWDHTYPELVAMHKDYSYRLQTDPASVCHKCTRSKGYYQEKIADMPIFGVRDYIRKWI